MATNKDSVRKQIVTVSTDMFLKKGIKSITMDDIAHAVGISKRTLYEIFDNKESLLNECMTVWHNNNITDVECLKLTSSDVLDALFSVYQYGMDKLNCFSKEFIDDLEKYPVAKKILSSGQIREIDEFRTFFESGVKSGIFIPDINYDILSKVIKFQSQAFSGNKELFDGMDFKEVGYTLIFSFLRGIVTDKGRKRLDDFISTIHVK